MSLLNIELSPYHQSMHDEHSVFFGDFLQRNQHAYLIHHLPNAVLTEQINEANTNCTVVNWYQQFKSIFVNLDEQLLSSWQELIAEDAVSEPNRIILLILPRIDIQTGRKLFNQMRVNLNTTGLEETPLKNLKILLLGDMFTFQQMSSDDDLSPLGKELLGLKAVWCFNKLTLNENVLINWLTGGNVAYELYFQQALGEYKKEYANNHEQTVRKISHELVEKIRHEVSPQEAEKIDSYYSLKKNIGFISDRKGRAADKKMRPYLRHLGGLLVGRYVDTKGNKKQQHTAHYVSNLETNSLRRNLLAHNLLSCDQEDGRSFVRIRSPLFAYAVAKYLRSPHVMLFDHDEQFGFDNRAVSLALVASFNVKIQGFLGYSNPDGLDQYLDALIDQLEDEDSKDYWLLSPLSRISPPAGHGKWWTRIPMD